jgi:hypothetical protein
MKYPRALTMDIDGYAGLNTPKGIVRGLLLLLVAAARRSGRSAPDAEAAATDSVSVNLGGGSAPQHTSLE